MYITYPPSPGMHQLLLGLLRASLDFHTKKSPPQRQYVSPNLSPDQIHLPDQYNVSKKSEMKTRSINMLI